MFIFSISSFYYFSLSHCNVLRCMLQQRIGLTYEMFFSFFLNKFLGPDRAASVGKLWIVTRGKIFPLLFPEKKPSSRFFSLLLSPLSLFSLLSVFRYYLKKKKIREAKTLGRHTLVLFNLL